MNSRNKHRDLRKQKEEEGRNNGTGVEASRRGQDANCGPRPGGIDK